MTLTKAEEFKLLHLLLDMGEMLYCSGGEVRRVENTISLMGKAYGAIETSVMVITASIIVTMKFSDGNLVTETRRISSAGGNKLWRIESLNALSRRCCEEPMPLETLESEIKNCRQPTKLWKFYLGSALAAGAFAVFFGGNIYDGIVAAAVALIVCVLQRKIANIFPNNIIFNIVCSFMVGGIIALSSKFFPIHSDKVIIGVIMILIPGIAFTNSVRDVLVGDTISGIMRLIESLLWAAGLAIGFMLALWCTGVNQTSSVSEVSNAIQLITGTLGSVGFATLFGLRVKYIPFAAIGGFLCWGMYLIGIKLFDESILFAGLMASAVSALYGEITARIKKAPATLFYITSIIPLIPGSTLYYACSNAVIKNFEEAQYYALRTLQYSLSIAAGACIIWAITITVENIKKNKKIK